ncbi:MAG: hypothetical protein LKI18_08170 [Prevotella sp.]|nr:hypothetical protein [Prevotella sp.]
MFAQDVKFYKFSEFILFFYRFAVGCYGGSSWQSFDLRRIGIAFHQEFLPERNLELARIDRELMQAKRGQHEYFRPLQKEEFSNQIRKLKRGVKK